MLLITNRRSGAQIKGTIGAIYAYFGFHRGADILDGIDPVFTITEPPKQNRAFGVFSVTKG